VTLFIAGLATPSDCTAQTFVDVTRQVTITKSGLVLNRATNTFNSVVSITNISGAVLNAPLVLVISNISPATVTLANPSGKGPSGNPFISVTVPGDGLGVGKNIADILLEFTNPSRAAFTFTVSASNIAIQPEALPEGVTGPLIESVPPAAALVDQALSYQVIASSANPSSLIFSLTAAPQGMSINPATGLLQWTPGPNQVGDQAVTIDAQDSGGQTSQSFTLSVFGSAPVTTVTISAATGGVITVNDPGSPINGLSISIPAGALAANTTFTVSALTLPPTLNGTPRFFMTGFSISPDGISLASPATVKLPYNPSQFGTGQGIPLEGFLGVQFLQSSTGKLQFLNSSVDKVNHILTAAVPHFSVLLFDNVAELCPPPVSGSLCGSSYSPSTLSLLTPAVMVHGFVLPLLNGGMGDEATWGNLRTMLVNLDSGGPGRIDAWRFDWCSFSVPFEESAANLSTALEWVEGVEQSPVVNIVAHSFGGILARTYIAGLGSGQTPYNNDISRIMTVGTPHTGIGGNLSTYFASACAAQAQYDPFSVTCFESGTGQQPLPGGFSGEGDFLRALNTSPLPGFPGGGGPNAFPPWFQHYKGQTLSVGTTGATTLNSDDGLITAAGAELCGAPVNVCAGAYVQEETIADSASDFEGLCHSGALFGTTCDSSKNVAMVAVTNTSHPLWDSICSFLGCGPAINITLSPAGLPDQGLVIIDPTGSKCGAGPGATSQSQACQAPPVGSIYAGGVFCRQNCTVLYPDSSLGSNVELVPFAQANGYFFNGWTGDCTGTSDCELTIVPVADKPGGYNVTATFVPGVCVTPQYYIGTFVNLDGVTAPINWGAYPPVLSGQDCFVLSPITVAEIPNIVNEQFCTGVGQPATDRVPGCTVTAYGSAAAEEAALEALFIECSCF